MPTRTMGNVSAYTPMPTHPTGHFPDAPSRKRIGEWLARERERAGLSQRQVSVTLDVDSQTVSRWETGANPIKAEDLFRLVFLYKADILQLLARKVTRAAGAAAESEQERKRRLG